MSRLRVSPPAAALGLALGLLLVAPGPARAARDLDAEMAEMARQIQAEVKERGNAVVVGEFRGPARLASTGGPAIAKALREQLEKADVRVTRDATLEVNGEFRDVVDRDSKKTALQIKAKIEDRMGVTIVELRSRGIFDLTTIGALTGITLATPPLAAGDEAREESITKALDKIQPPSLKGIRISAAPRSRYAIEVLVGPDPKEGKPDLSKYRPRAPALDSSGLAFLKIERGEVYAISVINDATHDVAVTLTIDGLDVFTFADKKGYEMMVVPPGKTGLIAGWFRTEEKSDSFLVAEFARSAVARALPRSSEIGTIHASFRACWPKDGNPPADEPGGRSGDATAQGKEINIKYKPVVRVVGKPREAVAVRYNKSGEPANLPDSKPAP